MEALWVCTVGRAAAGLGEALAGAGVTAELAFQRSACSSSPLCLRCRQHTGWAATSSAHPGPRGWKRHAYALEGCEEPRSLAEGDLDLERGSPAGLGARRGKVCRRRFCLVLRAWKVAAPFQALPGLFGFTVNSVTVQYRPA